MRRVRKCKSLYLFNQEILIKEKKKLFLFDKEAIFFVFVLSKKTSQKLKKLKTQNFYANLTGLNCLTQVMLEKERETNQISRPIVRRGKLNRRLKICPYWEFLVYNCYDFKFL